MDDSVHISPVIAGSETPSSIKKAIHNTSNWASTSVFLSQIIVVYIVIFAAIINLTLFPEGRQELWITLLSSSIGYLLPSPTIKKPSNKTLFELSSTNNVQ